MRSSNNQFSLDATLQTWRRIESVKDGSALTLIEIAWITSIGVKRHDDLTLILALLRRLLVARVREFLVLHNDLSGL